MKITLWLFFLVALVSVVSCSKKTATSLPMKSLPFNPILVEPPETTEIYATKKQADALLKAMEFDKLDELAKEFRDSGACYAHGMWKLSYFYEGLNFPAGDANDADWTNHLSVLRDWVRGKPESITARVALAQGLIGYAWHARGHDYADKVTDEGWRLFFQRHNAAVAVLNEATNLDQKCPCWWTAMLRAELAMQVERSQYDTSFNAAIQAWPKYAPFYFHRSNYLLPRWYGAEGELEKDLEQSADRIGGEAGDMLYAQVCWNLQGLVDSKNEFDEYHLSWERAKKGMQALERRYPDSLAVKNETAHLAALANDLETARENFQWTKGQIDESCWASTNQFIACARFVYGIDQ